MIPVKTKKKLVCFDTSFIRGASIQKIEKKYPVGENKWCLSETVDLELNDFCGKKDKEIRAKNFSKIIKDERFKILYPRGQILSFECKKYLKHLHIVPGCFPVMPEKFQKDRIGFVLHKNKLALSKMESRVREMNKYEDFFWCLIRRCENPKNNFTQIDLILTLKCLIESREQILVDDGPDINEMANNDPNGFMRHCPSCFNLIRVKAFLKMLEKGKDETSGFTVGLDGEKVKITKSFVTDIVIAMAFLPYIDFFVTSDKGQARTLAYIVRDLERKICVST